MHSTLKVEIICSSATMLRTYQTTLCCNAEYNKVNKLGLYENRELRGTVGIDRGSAGRWRELHFGELYDFYSLPNIKKIRS
jgi:hypothetical protein